MRGIATLAALACAALFAAKGFSARAPSTRDMRQLHERCLRAARSESVRFAAYKNTKLNGLQFYLKGRLRRYTPSEPESKPEEDFDVLLREMKNPAPGQSFVLVATRHKGDNLAEKLDENHIRYACDRGKQWWVFSVAGDQEDLPRRTPRPEKRNQSW